MQDLSVSVVVPSYRRAEDLARCLDGLAAQTLPPREVIVVLRPDDADGHAAAAAAPCEVTVVDVERPGQVAALNRGCAAAGGDIIAITDDDARPHADWVERIAERFASDPRIGAVGGRDVVYWLGEVIGGESDVVGRVRWWGRRVGNHHHDSVLQDVDFIKGANMAIRASADAVFDEHLRGRGAQICNDMEVSWAIRRRGWRVVWDPGVKVDHFPAERDDDDKREGRSLAAECNEQHNEVYGLILHAPWWQRPVIFGYLLLVGTRQAPGLLLGLRRLPHARDRRRIAALSRARASALVTLRRARRSARAVSSRPARGTARGEPRSRAPR
jgi:GT2 family glycosyltransferase